MKIELSEPKTDEELEAYYRLRWERLRKPHGLPLGSEREELLEASSEHLVAEVEHRIVGSVCWAIGMDHDPISGARTMFVRLRQVAVDADYEGHGLGSTLIRHVEAVARKLGAAELRSNVRVENIRLFERCGYSSAGPGETLFAEIEHVSMVNPLT